jgi:hypothetical protein
MLMNNGTKFFLVWHDIVTMVATMNGWFLPPIISISIERGQTATAGSKRKNVI